MKTFLMLLIVLYPVFLFADYMSTILIQTTNLDFFQIRFVIVASIMLLLLPIVDNELTEAK